LCDIILSRRLRLFGHIAHADSMSNHRRALYSVIHRLPADWNRPFVPRGRPQHTWTRTIEADLRSANIDLHMAWHRAQDRETCRKFMQTTMLSMGSVPDDDDDGTCHKNSLSYFSTTWAFWGIRVH
jgi:hypothetical protein